MAITASGEPNSLPADFMPFANEFPEVTLILAHLGNSGAAGSSLELQVRAIQASRHGNVYADTSSRAGVLTPGRHKARTCNLAPENKTDFLVHHPENAENSEFCGLFYASAGSACTLYKAAQRGVSGCTYTRSKSFSWTWHGLA
jgi:hypothetical protein